MRGERRCERGRLIPCGDQRQGGTPPLTIPRVGPRAIRFGRQGGCFTTACDARTSGYVRENRGSRACGRGRAAALRASAPWARTAFVVPRGILPAHPIDAWRDRTRQLGVDFASLGPKGRGSGEECCADGCFLLSRSFFAMINWVQTSATTAANKGKTSDGTEGARSAAGCAWLEKVWRD